MNARFLLPTLALFGPLAAAAGAQCTGPDGFDGACCSTVTPNIPALPSFTLPGQGICWSSCTLSSQNCVVVTLQQPTATSTCGQYSSLLVIEDCTGLPLMTGTATLDYTRHWSESQFPGTVTHDVYRFMLKVDLAGTFSSTPVCPVPPCVDTTAHAETFWYGYVDYALECSVLAWEPAMVLFHGCDELQHGPLSAKPGTFHPADSFAIVAPDTTANPFVPYGFLPMVPPSGTLTADAMRDVSTPGTCEAKEYIVGGALSPIGSACFCPLTFFPDQTTASHFSGSSSCGSSFFDISFWPLTPWFYFLTTGIGSWTTSASYPGPEEAYASEGLFLYNDLTCTGSIDSYVDVMYGSMTRGGFTVVPDPAILVTDQFVDLASNYSLLLPSTPVFPLMGEVKPTSHLIYGNTL